MGRRQSPLRLEVQKHMGSGLKTREIAEKLGVPTARIYHLIYAIRGASDAEDGIAKADAPVAKAVRLGTISMGGIARTLHRHPYALGMWLLKNTPEGGSIADTLIALATDAMNDEIEAGV